MQAHDCRSRRTSFRLKTVLHLTLAVFFVLLSVGQVQGDEHQVKRALLDSGDGEPDHAANRDHLKTALLTGDWEETNIDTGGLPSDPGSGFVTEFFKDAKDTDISLFFFTGHGGQAGDVVGEAGEKGSDETVCFLGKTVPDDDLQAIFKDVKGIKVLIFTQCHSGGVVGGGTDLQPGNDTIVITSCSEDKSAWVFDFTNEAGDVHRHNHFVAHLISGLTNTDDQGFVLADKNKNGQVTVREWFDHAEFFTDLLIGEFDQEPQIRDPGKIADTVVIYSYDSTQKRKNASPEGVAPKLSTRKSDCGCDSQGDIFKHFSGGILLAWQNPEIDIRSSNIRIETASPPVLVLQMVVDGSIPVQPAAFFASWHFLVDIDGDRSTGHPGYRRPVGVFPDLGVDLWADLLWDGQAFRPMLFLGPFGIPFLIDTPGLLQVTVDESRTVITMRIPVEPLEQLFSSLYGRPITIAEQNVKWVAVTNYCATEADCDDPPSDFFPDDLYKPILFLNLNQATFRQGDTLTKQVGARNVGPAYNADFYLGAVLPDGVTLVFVTNLSPLTLAIGTLPDPRTFQPLVRNVSVPEGFEQVFDNVVSYTFSGGEPQGGYIAFDALTRPAAFSDGFNDPGDIQAIDLQPFSVGP